ncbi:hypothetical protein H1P_1390007 [Hyella patelloides LEGE 07179]|uniref:Uncharacterized protein n=1 Tax=Hyella patelloides LEGE 07179 TaxID=945734 RepID=A0A563VLH4_9CYAN|nr:hypothetical protein H1P_1390007 [Hyella patelloides LEGE 07179]
MGYILVPKNSYIYRILLSIPTEFIVT